MLHLILWFHQPSFHFGLFHPFFAGPGGIVDSSDLERSKIAVACIELWLLQLCLLFFSCQGYAGKPLKEPVFCKCCGCGISCCCTSGSLIKPPSQQGSASWRVRQLQPHHSGFLPLAWGLLPLPAETPEGTAGRRCLPPQRVQGQKTLRGRDWCWVRQRRSCRGGSEGWGCWGPAAVEMRGSGGVGRPWSAPRAVCQALSQGLGIAGYFGA